MIIHLTSLLDNNSDEYDKVKAFLGACCNESKEPRPEHESEIGPLHILASIINKSEAEDVIEFVVSTQLHVEEP